MNLLTKASPFVLLALPKCWQLWSVYDGDFDEDRQGTGLHFSARLDDSTQVDLRWVCTLVLHTLERLHDSAKWESLAHFGFVFNSYTR